ncbi:hypothetical protein AB0I81_39975 [Nonomuraea sp. NPDC050404]|uniref:zinc finger domain-containing protein n=1 Tax=Nonomuraea sp. NPDC050404 TaxID=3155783 RepID=UPI0033FB6CB2
MTPTETVTFLRALGLKFPTFQWEAGTASEWHKSGLAFVSPTDAEAAAQSLVRKQSFVALADVLAEVRRIRDQRGAGQLLPAPPNPDDTTAYRAELVANLRRRADGFHIDTPRALPAGQRRPGPPPAEFLRARGRNPAEELARSIQCPWCQAMPHTSCTNAIQKPLPQSHQARHDAARALTSPPE